MGETPWKFESSRPHHRRNNYLKINEYFDRFQSRFTDFYPPMMGAGNPRVFSYRTWHLGFAIAATFAVFLPVVAEAIAMLFGVNEYPFWMGVWNFVQPLNAGWVWALLIALCVWSFRRHHAVRVCLSGIEELRVFGSRKLIEWRQVHEISRTITFQREHGGLVETLSFHGDGKTILVYSYIDDFEELKAAANRYVACLRIPISNLVEAPLRERYAHLSNLSETQL